jgi:protein O-mannosyl-transferase
MKWLTFILKHFIIAILLITGFSYFPIIFNEFVNWDDGVYITENPLIQTFTINNLWYIFTHSFEGHYHPVTLISLMTDYFIWGINPLAFHLHNVLLHLINILLVFNIILKLSKNTTIAGLTALLFAIHPIHVEAVAWATARKDVLFSMYFLLSILFYQYYLKNKEKKWYWLSLSAALLSGLAKGQGVLLPFCLLLIDYYHNKNIFTLKTWKNKIPFLVPLLFLGIIALIAQNKTGYIGSGITDYNLSETLVLAPFSLLFYFYKIIIPVNLSAYYLLPDLTNFSMILYIILGILIFAAITYLMCISYRRNKVVFFGLAFFMVNIFVFLRWFPVSNYLIADRYTYISSIGLFFIIGHYYAYWEKKFRITIAPFIIIVLILTFLTFQRVKIWRDSMTLVTNILEYNPDVYPALNIRGKEKEKQGDIKGAMTDYNKAVSLQPENWRALANRGLLYLETGYYDEALADFNKALMNNSDNYIILNNRGLLYFYKGNIRAAEDDFNRVIKIAPDFAEAYNNRGMLYAVSEKFEEAMNDFNKAISINSSYAGAYANRGKCRNKQGDFYNAIKDIEKSIAFGLETYLQYFEMGYAYYNIRDFKRASGYFTRALNLQPGDAKALEYRGYAYYNLGNYKNAFSDLTEAIDADENNALAYAMRGLTLIALQRNNEACDDFYKAEKLGLSVVRKEIETHCRN